MKKIIIVGVLVILATLTACTSSQGGGQESMIKVLYVGQDPNTVEGYSYGGDREYIEELKQTRAAEFMGL
ncbi:MAG: hypothetical protein OIF34_03100, partial [Porticoccaceae bacterium]|nr:hypothetical protein [Porticoccaceae bacterium]